MGAMRRVGTAQGLLPPLLPPPPPPPLLFFKHQPAPMIETEQQAERLRHLYASFGVVRVDGLGTHDSQLL